MSTCVRCKRKVDNKTVLCKQCDAQLLLGLRTIDEGDKYPLIKGCKGCFAWKIAPNRYGSSLCEKHFDTLT